MALKPPPPTLPVTVRRFYSDDGKPTPDQVRYETGLRDWLVQLTASVLPLKGATLPTTDPHVVGELWNSAGVVKISAG
jgi:hypothetical protein